jgi:hypothetical protein
VSVGTRLAAVPAPVGEVTVGVSVGTLVLDEVDVGIEVGVQVLVG